MHLACWRSAGQSPCFNSRPFNYSAVQIQAYFKIFLSTLISGKIVASPVMEHIFHGIKHFTLKGHCSQTTYSLGTIIVDQSCYPWVVSYSYSPPPQLMQILSRINRCHLLKKMLMTNNHFCIPANKIVLYCKLEASVTYFCNKSFFFIFFLSVINISVCQSRDCLDLQSYIAVCFCTVHYFYQCLPRSLYALFLIGPFLFCFFFLSNFSLVRRIILRFCAKFTLQKLQRCNYKSFNICAHLSPISALKCEIQHIL